MKKLFCALLVGLCLISVTWASEKNNSNNAISFYEKGHSLYKAKKYTDAMVTWKKAVNEGNGQAAFWVGELYREGHKGIAKNWGKAVEWYEKAFNMGYKRAGAFVALCYAYAPDPVKRDFKKAYETICTIENMEDDFVLLTASQFYMNGWGTKTDFDRAREIAGKIKNNEKRAKALKEIDSNEEFNTPIFAGELIKEVEQNQMRFDKKHKKKPITVKGFIGSIEEKDGRYVVEIFGEKDLPNPFEFVECRFAKRNENMLLELDAGEVTTVRGIYTGKIEFQMGALVLHDCHIVE